MHPIVIVMQQAEALPAHLTAHTCAAPHLMSWGKHIVLCICHSSLRHVLYTPAAMGGMGGMGGGMPGGMGGGMPGGMGGGMPGGGRRPGSAWQERSAAAAAGEADIHTCSLSVLLTDSFGPLATG